MNREELLKEAKPILFNTEMVRAILDGRKTVTRRVIKGVEPEAECLGVLRDSTGREDARYIDRVGFKCSIGTVFPRWPYENGDILYVRETFEEHPKIKDKFYYRANSECAGKLTAGDCPDAYNRTDNCNLCEWLGGGIKWHPSIHMPKAAARIFLRVKYVRVERLQDITTYQISLEGVGESCIGLSVCGGGCYDCSADPNNYRPMFSNLWDSTIKKSDIECYGWDANPWVWVIEFEKVRVEDE